jgi:thiamine pyrophosphokinase
VQDPPREPISAPPIVAEGTLLIVGGGTLDAHLLHRLAATGARLVGADSGGDAIRAAGLIPDAIVGDFDSLADAGSWDARTRLIRIAEQDSTDFEKALYSTVAPVTIALGMSGQRLDHTLAALDAMARYGADRHIILVDESDLALAVAGSFSFAVTTGARVSVHPLTPTRFARSSGLKYPLDGLRLAPGERTGTSNAAIAPQISIETEAGDAGVWLLILERCWLDTLVDLLLVNAG